MLRAVKLALGVTVDDYDEELQDLIQAALFDLQTNGVDAVNLQADPLILQAMKTYCRAHFHSPADYDRLAAAYDAQKGHLMNASGYTDFPAAVPSPSFIPVQVLSGPDPVFPAITRTGPQGVTP